MIQGFCSLHLFSLTHVSASIGSQMPQSAVCVWIATSDSRLGTLTAPGIRLLPRGTTSGNPAYVANSQAGSFCLLSSLTSLLSDGANGQGNPTPSLTSWPENLGL